MSNMLILTAHDYRTPRKASLHFIADELVKNHQVRFFSLRYSLLSRNRPDGRHDIVDKANKLETVNGVDCYFWKTLLHPINTRKPILQPLEKLAFKLYVRCAPKILKDWIKRADTIFFESGAPPIFLDLAIKLNPNARKVYIASDELDAINVAQYVKDIVYKQSEDFDAICVNSPTMAKDFSENAKRY